MKIICNNKEFILPEKTVVAIGKFDGDHLGHQKIFEEMRRIRQEYGLKMAAFTFVASGQPQIASGTEKRDYLAKEGIDYLIEYPFTDDVRTTGALDFLKDVLIRRMNMAWIVAGSECSFGYNKSGNADMLRFYSEEFGYKTTFIQKLTVNDSDISSTRIRKLISDGDVEKIHELKGEYYSISGPVIHNKNLGKKIGFPTANIVISPYKVIPAYGVYATKTQLEDGRVLDSMTNIGINPTVRESDNNDIKCETHIFDFNENIYGQKINISFIKYIRNEQRFHSVDELKHQLESDRTVIKHYFSESNQ